MAMNPGVARWVHRFRQTRRRTGLWLRQPMLPVFLSWRLCLDDDVMRVHRRPVAALVGRHPFRWLLIGASVVLWPAKSVVLIFRYTRIFGPEVERTEGRSRARQALDQFRLAWGHSISPHSYYTFGFSRREQRRMATRFLYDAEGIVLFQSLNEDSVALSLSNKLLFDRILSARGLPSVPTIAWTERGELVWARPAEPELPPQDLFVKPIASFAGQGAMLWEYMGSGMYSSVTGAALCASYGVRLPGKGTAILHGRDLCSLVVVLSQREEMLVQPRLFNDPELADLSTGALLTARILTGCLDGKAEFIRGVFKMPVGRSVVVNFGIVAPIDDTGTLGAATPFGPSPVRHVRHPDTSANILGRCLPCWDGIREVAVAAHESLPEYTFVGWDIALTPDGIYVIEGNAGWGAESLQKPHGSPLMDTRFLPICLARIEQQHLRRRASRMRGAQP